MKCLNKIILLIFIASGFINPQQKFILNSNSALSKINLTNNSRNNNIDKKVLDKTLGMDDTLDYREYTYWNGVIRFFGQDVIMQWFQAPTDMFIKAIGINCWVNADSNASVQIGLKKINLNTDTLLNLVDKPLGYFNDVNNGYNNIAPFEEDATEPITWMSKSLSSSPFTNIIEEKINVTLKKTDNEYPYEFQWIDLDSIGYFPEIKQGEIIGVMIKNNFPDLEMGGINCRGMIQNQSVILNQPGWKFYANGRYAQNGIADTSTKGWWGRGFTFDMALAAEMSECGNPHINIIQLNSIVSTEPREINAEIIGRCATITTASIDFEINDNNDWQKVSMSKIGENLWQGFLPGMNPGSRVTYRVTAIASDGRKGQSDEYSYNVFAPTPNIKTLLVFNGNNYSGTTPFPQAFYYGTSDFINYTVREFPHDIWAYGPLSDELVSFYDNILEFTTPSPDSYNDSVIVRWLNSAPNHNYFLAGQEWLGQKYENKDSAFTSGSFEYDQLGITHSYNDVSYANTTGQFLPSRLYPVQGSLLCSDLFDLYNLQTPGDSLQYHPYYELGTGYTNWIDGYKVDTNRVEVDMYVETRGIEGQAHVELLPCASHLTLPAGNKIAFFSFDPLALDSSPDYYWYGFSKESPQNKVLDWFGITTEVDDEPVLYPQAFKLYQNYPNPFNPVTTIIYSIPVETRHASSLQNVQLKVYDVLGKEVITLINEEQQPGYYTINFDASQFTSGIYFYELRTGNFVSIKKMIILR